MRFVVTFAVFVLSAGAQAQLWQTAERTSSQPYLRDFHVDGNVLTRGEATVKLDTAGGLVVGLLVESPDVEDVARALSAAWEQDSVQEFTTMMNAPAFREQASHVLRTYSGQYGLQHVVTQLVTTGGRDWWRAYVGVNVIADAAFPPTRAVSGSAHAPNTLHVLSAFDCGACFLLWGTLIHELRQDGQAYRVSVHPYPLGDGGKGLMAAEAAECAADQDRFWPFYDAVFGDALNWVSLPDADAERRLTEFARAVGLEPVAFQRCYDTHTYRAGLLRERDEDARLFPVKIPALFLNGVRLFLFTAEERARIIQVTSDPGLAPLIQRRLDSFK